MATEIQIDDEVKHALEQRAVEERLVFGTPNQVLRIVLGLDQPRNPDTAPASTTTNPPMTTSVTSVGPEGAGRTHLRIGPRLLREHHELQGRKGYYSKTGIPYQKPDQFPAVFFDPDGYLVVKDETSMRINPYINVGRQVSVPGGIRSVPGYVNCRHSHE